MPAIKVNEQLVKHVAMLAKLNLSSNEVAKFEVYMKQILGYVESLDKVNTADVEPLFSPIMDVENFYMEEKGSEFTSHEDVVKAFEQTASILRNAPKREEGQYKIKAIIEEQ